MRGGRLAAGLFLAAACLGAQTPTPTAPSKWETLPIAAYDTDTGYGLGVKTFLLNRLQRQESLDVILFASTKGERWAKVVVSHPDFGTREGTIFPLALDLKVDYDRMTHSHFYGVGNRSKSSDFETFNKEPLLVEGTASHAFSHRILLQAGLRYRWVRNSRFVAGGLLETLGGGSAGLVQGASAFLNLRYDTRDSYLVPTRGWVLEGEWEDSPGGALGDESDRESTLTVRRYFRLPVLRTVLALRARLQDLSGQGLPVQTLLSLGGGDTLRGYAQDRFLGTASALANLELRFPLVGRLGAVAGYDAGKVWDGLRKANLGDWPGNPDLGLRFYMHTFIVRLDLGLGREGTGLYLNFDQIL